MNTTPKPQRAFFTVTLLTVIAVSTVFMVYAAVLLTLYGTTVTVNEPSGTSVQYNRVNDSNSSWVTSFPTSINTSIPWYTRINITNTASQDVTINWVLEKNTGSWIWVATPVNTTITLAAGLNTVYATDTGVFTGNYNWGTLTTTGGSYRVKAIING